MKTLREDEQEIVSIVLRLRTPRRFRCHLFSSFLKTLRVLKNNQDYFILNTYFKRNVTPARPYLNWESHEYMELWW